MNEPMQDGLRDALRKMREDASRQGAPAALEDQLAQAFRAHHCAAPAQTRKTRKRWMWVPAAAVAASLLVVFVTGNREPVKVETAQIVEKIPAASLPVAIAKPVGSAAPALVAKPRPAPSKARRHRVPSRPLSLASAKPAPRKAEQEPFIQIPYAPPFTPNDEGQILRVNMTGSSVRRMGIPVAAQQVQADLLVGNDGLPRALRLVSHSSNSY